jgi:rhomboid protease GluP
MSAWFDSPEWRWRRQRWRQRWSDWRARWSDRKRQVAYRHTICPHCGALVDGRDRQCAACGGNVGGRVAKVSRRLFCLALPGECPVTFVLLALNLLIAFLTLRPDPLWRHALLETSSLIPPYVLQRGEWYRLITYAYLHGGLLHIAFNMLALHQMGPLLEPVIGPRRFFALYTLAAVAGGGADLLFRGGDFIVVVGASGALCGLIGGGIAYAHLRGAREVRDALLNWVGMMVVYSVLFEVLGGIHVDHLAHGGGLLAGLALGALIGQEERMVSNAARARADTAWAAAFVFCFVFTGLALVQAVMALRALPF